MPFFQQQPVLNFKRVETGIWRAYTTDLLLGHRHLLCIGFCVHSGQRQDRWLYFCTKSNHTEVVFEWDIFFLCGEVIMNIICLERPNSSDVHFLWKETNLFSLSRIFHSEHLQRDLIIWRVCDCIRIFAGVMGYILSSMDAMQHARTVLTKTEADAAHLPAFEAERSSATTPIEVEVRNLYKRKGCWWCWQDDGGGEEGRTTPSISHERQLHPKRW